MSIFPPEVEFGELLIWVDNFDGLLSVCKGVRELILKLVKDARYWLNKFRIRLDTKLNYNKKYNPYEQQQIFNAYYTNNITPIVKTDNAILFNEYMDNFSLSTIEYLVTRYDAINILLLGKHKNKTTNIVNLVHIDGVSTKIANCPYKEGNKVNLITLRSVIIRHLDAGHDITLYLPYMESETDKRMQRKYYLSKTLRNCD